MKLWLQFLLVGSIASIGVRAQIPEGPNYVARFLGMEQGLPSDVTFSVAQDPRGFIWIATAGGVVRYDGRDFESFESVAGVSVPGKPIAAGVLGRAVWVLFEEGVALRWVPGRQPVVFTLPAGTPWRRLDADQGGLYIRGGINRVFRFDGRAFVEMDSQDTLQHLQPAGGGRAFVSGRQIASMDSLGGISVLVPVNEATQGLIRRSIVDPSTGEIVFTRDGRIHSITDEETRSLPIPGEMEAELRRLRDGRVVFWTVEDGRHQLMQADFERMQVVVLHDAGVIDDVFNDTFEDDEGNLWISTGRRGILQLRPSPLSRLYPDEPILRVSGYGEGSGVVAASGCGLLHFASLAGPGRSLTSIAGERLGCVYALHEAPGGDLWIATDRNLIRLQSDGAQAIRVQNGAIIDYTAIADRADGGLWVGTNRGLYSLPGGADKERTQFHDFPEERVLALAPDGDSLWIGTNRGLHLQVGPETRSLDMFALPTAPARDVKVLESGLVVVAWYGWGLSLIKGDRILNVRLEHGLADNYVSGVLEDGPWVWLHTNTGLHRVERAVLDGLWDGSLHVLEGRVLDAGDGLAEANGGGPSSLTRARDGTVWLASVDGLLAVTDLEFSPQTRPRTRLRQVRVNDQPVILSDDLRLRPDQSDFAVLVTGLSLTRPDRVRYMHNLEGLDERWRITENPLIRYSNLSPGDYRLRVRSFIAGVSPPGDEVSIPFVRAGYFYQTVWFRVFFVLAAMAMTALAFISYAERQRRRRIELGRLNRALIKEIKAHMKAKKEVSRMARHVLHAQEEERRAVAAELHDELGGKLTFLQALLQTDQDRSEGMRVVQDIFNTVRRMVRHMRPQSLDLFGLCSVSRELVEEYQKAAEIEASLDLCVGEDRRFHKDVETTAYRFVQEGLTNAIRHGHAKRIMLRMEEVNERLVLTLRDDGDGFDPSTSEFGVGLTAMIERSELLGGSTRIESEPGVGTVLRMEIPALPPA